ncbi:hypothetical protein CGK38_20600, partial [Vibrio parahaemolyticus]
HLFESPARNSRAFVVLGAVIFPSKKDHSRWSVVQRLRHLYQSGKLTDQVYPPSRAHFGDSFGAIQKPILCIADFGDDVVVISKILIG